MKIIRMEANPSGSYPSPQDWSGTEIPEGFAAVPANLNLSGFYAAKGFVTLSVADQTVTGFAVNQEALDAWDAEHPEPDPLEAAKEAKLAELSTACNAVIVAGCDVTLSDGSTGHIALTNEDQINLTNAAATVAAGAEEYPYHLDGQLCAMYSAADIQIMGQAATAHKLYHTTYYNHLAAWVRRCGTAEAVAAITYGAELPEDLAANMAAILGAAANA